MRPLAVCLSLLLLSCTHVPAEEPSSGLLFHASFDDTTESRVAAGANRPVLAEGMRIIEAVRSKYVDGVFGRGIVGLPRSFDAHTNVLPERGTIAFFYRPGRADATHDPLVIRTVDSYYWDTYLQVSYWKQRLAVWIADEAFDVQKTSADASVKLGADWQHLAVVWDQARGAVLYLDGRAVASSWGRQSWTSRGVDPGEILLSWNTGAAYDELYVFDRPLRAQQIVALARENRAPSERELEAQAVEFGELDRANRLRELGWAEPGDLPRLALGTPERIRQVSPTDARAQKKAMSAVFDGKLGEGWPPRFLYDYNGGDGLSVQNEGLFDLVALEGRFAGDVYAGRHLVRPERERPLATLEPGAFRRYWSLDRLRDGWISFFHRPGKRPVRGWVNELAFYQRGMADLTGASTRALWIATADAPAADTPLERELLARFGPGDRTVLPVVDSGADAPPRGRQARPLDALRYHHVIVPAAAEPRGLLGVGLQLWLRGAKPDDKLRVEVRDPALPARRLFALDFTLDVEPGAWPQSLDLLLDLRDRLLPAGKPLWVSLAVSSDVELLSGGENASRVDLYEAGVERALPEYVDDELLFVRSRFRELSELRPWLNFEAPERQLTRTSRRAAELFTPLVALRRYAPDNPRVRALWAWTHKSVVDRSPVDLAHVGGHVPRWALLQREIVRASRDILSWWVDHRQVPNGEFGDDWNDDTDLIQNFPALVLLGDPERRLADAARCTAEGVYENRMSGGINTHPTDSPHAYSDGVNAQSVMALIDWGDPRYLERLMQTSATVASRLTRKDARGRRRFVSSHIGARQSPNSTGFDSTDNALFLHPALMLAYYAGTPGAVELTREWVDGWLDYYDEAERSGTHPKGRPYPSRTELSGNVVAWDTKARGYGYVSLFTALHDLTGEPRYRDAVRYWTGDYAPRASFMRGNLGDLPALGLMDRERFRPQLLQWAEEADVSRPYVDGFGRVARERFMKWELTGDESAVYESLEATLRNLRGLRAAYTWGEPIADRIWLPVEGVLTMMQGDVSHVRNQLWPRHYTSYDGFSDYGAWVREKSDTKLRIWLYSFADEEEQGNVRVWRAPPGRYDVRVGVDADLDGEPDEPAEQELALHRAAPIALTLPPGERVVLTLELLEPDESWATRPDLAVSLSVPGGARPGMRAVVHNVGAGGAKAVRVELRRPDGRVVAERYVGSLDAPRGFSPSRRVLEFPRVKPGAGIVAVVDPEDEIPELQEGNNRGRVQRVGCSPPSVGANSGSGSGSG